MINVRHCRKRYSRCLWRCNVNEAEGASSLYLDHRHGVLYAQHRRSSKSSLNHESKVVLCKQIKTSMRNRYSATYHVVLKEKQCYETTGLVPLTFSITKTAAQVTRQCYSFWMTAMLSMDSGIEFYRFQEKWKQKLLLAVYCSNEKEYLRTCLYFTVVLQRLTWMWANIIRACGWRAPAKNKEVRLDSLKVGHDAGEGVCLGSSESWDVFVVIYDTPLVTCFSWYSSVEAQDHKFKSCRQKCTPSILPEVRAKNATVVWGWMEKDISHISVHSILLITCPKQLSC